MSRFDSYKNFKSRILIGGKTVAGLSWVSLPVPKHSGANPNGLRKLPGRRKFEAITLERGVTHDSEFEQWTNGALGGKEGSLNDLRKEIVNEAGRKTNRYKVHGSWISEFQAFPDLDGNANAVAIGHVKLENEGWEPDLELTRRPLE
jgi:phage tail-like protein